MKLHCPRCKRAIPVAQLNVERDVALCANCDEAFAISDLLAEGQGADVDVASPPKGAWFRETFDGWETGATTRSWARCCLFHLHVYGLAARSAGFMDRRLPGVSSISFCRYSAFHS